MTIFESYEAMCKDMKKQIVKGDPSIYAPIPQTADAQNVTLVTFGVIYDYSKEAIDFLHDGDFTKVYAWLREIRDASKVLIDFLSDKGDDFNG